MGICSGTNDLVEELTGQKPLEMMDYIVKNKALFSLRRTARLSGSNPDKGETLCLPAYS